MFWDSDSYDITTWGPENVQENVQKKPPGVAFAPKMGHPKMMKSPIPFVAWTWRSHHKALEYIGIQMNSDDSPKHTQTSKTNIKCDDQMTTFV